MPTGGSALCISNPWLLKNARKTTVCLHACMHSRCIMQMLWWTSATKFHVCTCLCRSQWGVQRHVLAGYQSHTHALEILGSGPLHANHDFCVCNFHLIKGILVWMCTGHFSGILYYSHGLLAAIIMSMMHCGIGRWFALGGPKVMWPI